MDPVLAKDAVIFFKKNDQWLPYQCATDTEITFSMETVSVKTIGDGTYNKPRGQKQSYSISTSGLIKFDDETYPHAFDLLEYWRGMTPIEYRMVFTIDGTSQLKKIEGVALPTTVTLGGGSEGFAYGNTTLEGDGGVDIHDALDPCPSSVTSIQLVQDGSSALIRITGHTGNPFRYDYSVDGGAPVTEFVDSYIEDLPLPGGLSVGEHSITITPVCDNGYSGETFEGTFEIAAVDGGGGDPCDVPGSLEISGITVNSANADWVGSIPGDGYYWELYMGAAFITSGSGTSQTVNLTGLAAGTEYTFKVKSICETGVSESTFVEASFTTTAAAAVTFSWIFDKPGIFGSLKITKNGLLVLNQGSSGSGTLDMPAGSEVVVYVTEPGGTTKTLLIQDTTAPLVLYNESSTDSLSFDFVTVAGHSYEVTASITS
jgi:hypothetical protein